ncbi:hypothetical protein [Kaistella sp.]|uniref:hypothetical protein n=1 Tax=Kaistella sp. TaxID=2782235 RepID=UPI002F93888C
MKKLAFISAVVFTAISLQSCRQADDVFSQEEIETLKKVQDSSNNSFNKTNDNPVKEEPNNPEASLVDGEIVPPPKK